MSIQFSLGIISLVELTSVPVRVADGSAVFHFDGHLVAEFDGLKPETVIQWTQIEGLPVTFLSPLNEGEIYFTSNDLDKKVFICCTNPGTDAEICTKAEFYHFPVSWVDGDIIGTSYGLGTFTNPDYPNASSFSAISHHGMLPVDHSLPGYSNAARFIGTMVKMEGVVDEYTETTFDYTATEEAVNDITGFSLMQSDGTSTSVIGTYVGYNPSILGVGSSSLDEWLQVEFYRYGYKYELTIPLTSTTSPGITEVINPPVKPSNGGILSMVSILSTFTEVTFEDMVSEAVSRDNLGGILGTETILQSKVTVTPPSDNSKVSSTNASSGITELTTFLQTSVNVT